VSISILSVGIGYVAGAFTPSIGRKIKSLFVKESSVVKVATSSAISSATKDVVKKL
jgi:hypothetical protein